MTDDITATFTVEEFVLVKNGLERLHFFGGKEVRERIWPFVKLNALLPSPGYSY